MWGRVPSAILRMKGCVIGSLFITSCLKKNSGYLIFYNLTKLKPIFIIFGRQYLDNPTASTTIYNFASNLMLIYFTFQFFKLMERTYFHASLMPIKNNILVTICICLNNTMHGSC